MRASARSTVLLLVVVLLPAVAGSSGAHQSRTVERLLANPLPFLDDAVSWRVEVPPGVVVCVSAAERGAASFWLRASGEDGPVIASPTPGLAQGLYLAAGTWTVTLDPAAGAAVDVLVEFAGYFGDCGKGPADFELVDLPAPPPCATEAGACLP